mmetsp:Transcript_5313/g.23717  ORF Transcript_5313/g.23717 Transcript_5313/m.23717 type:complete len:250 (-) Transcript_5313:1723-2472(-)
MLSTSNSSSSTSRTEERPRPIFFANEVSMYLDLCDISASTAGPPVSTAHTYPSHAIGFFLSLELITGALKPVLSDSSGSRYPRRVSPNSWHLHAIWKNESSSSSSAYRDAGMHATDAPRGASIWSKMVFTLRSSQTIARIFETMSLDWRKSDTARISGFSLIVCCVRGSRISVTMGMVSSSRVPPIAARFTVDLAMNPCSLSFLCLFCMSRMRRSVARHLESLCMMSPSSSSSAKMMQLVNFSMPMYSR